MALPVTSRLAWAQSYPSRPVHIIVGFPPGGGADITARIIGHALSERLNQPVVIDTRPGAGSNLAAEAVVRAPPDGYTLLQVTTANASNAALYPDLSFNFIPREHSRIVVFQLFVGWDSCTQRRGCFRRGHAAAGRWKES